MRIPAVILETEISIERLAPASGRGAAFAQPITRRAHVEESDRLVIDQRNDSTTAGTEIAARAYVLTQLADHAPAGSIITIRGERREVVATATYTNPHAPETAEHWAV